MTSRYTRRLTNLTTLDGQPVDRDLSALKAHVLEHHRNLAAPRHPEPTEKVVRRLTLAELAKAHQGSHHRLWQTHDHGDSERIRLRVRGLPVDLFDGELTGAGAVTKEQRQIRFREQHPRTPKGES